MFFVNGEEREVCGQSVAEYLAAAGYNVRRVAVEYNGAILPKSAYAETRPQDGDRLEIVSFVGGG